MSPIDIKVLSTTAMKTVFEKLAPGMDEATRDWLAVACAPLDRTPAALAA